MTPRPPATTRNASISDTSLRRYVYGAILVTLLLPPFFGGSMMGLIGIFPMPEFYLVFTSYSMPYVACWVVAGMLFAGRAVNFLIGLSSLEASRRDALVTRVLRPFPIYLFLVITLYSIGGATSANISLKSLGYADYDWEHYLLSYFGLIPVVLITVFPIFFHFTDYIGRYLGARGFHQVATPMWSKLVMLGLVTPTLIDTVLITYFVNRTGEYDIEMFAMWLLLVLLAAVGTYLALVSFRQGLSPLQQFLDSPQAKNGHGLALQPRSIDELGSLTGELATLLTERDAISDALSKEQNFTDAVLDNAGALLVVLDETGRIRLFNRACEKMTGYRFEEVEGRFVWDMLLLPDEAAKVRDEAFAALAEHPQGGTGHYTNAWVAKTGDVHTIEWSNTVLLDEQGRMDYMVSIGIDVTERLQALEALRQSEEKLRELNENLEARVAERTRALEVSNRELEAFSYSIAHDLRTPLRAITSFSQMLMMDARDKLGEEDADLLERIANSGKHMAQLIDDILSLGRVSRRDMAHEQLDLSALADEAIRELQSTDPDRKVEVHIEPGMTAYGDPQLVRLLLSNLLANAWKYTRDQQQPNIAFQRADTPSGPAFVVTDNGVGFDMVHTKHLFRPFHRLHAPEEFEGTGVGLATAHRIIERHHGRIWAEAEAERGAAFYFTLGDKQ